MPDENSAQSGRKRHFSQKQYDMLMRCSKAKDMTEWNEWRKHHRNVPILLERADLRLAHLEGANLWRAHLEGANLWRAHLEGARLGEAHLEGARLGEAHLERADLSRANLKGAKLVLADLKGAKLVAANLEGASLGGANLAGVHLWQVNLRGAKCTAANVDGRTRISDCCADRETDSREVALAEARMEPGFKTFLEGNNRVFCWRDWYKSRPPWKTWPVRLFWRMSDYGRSTGWVVLTFLVLGFLFAGIYWRWPSLVSDLAQPGEGLALRGLRAVYFSIVTMTTLGFGDMHAQPGNPYGYLLLMFHVVLGYLLLGALVTRLAILFTSAPPVSGPPSRRRKLNWRGLVATVGRLMVGEHQEWDRLFVRCRRTKE